MQKYKIKDLGKVITGKTPSTKIDEFYNSKDYLFVCPPDIKLQRYVEKADKYLSHKVFKKFQKIIIEKNSILISCIGNIGYIAISAKQCITNQQINSITCINTDIVLPMYLYYLLLARKDFLISIGQNGTTMPIINKSLFENIELFIHNLDKQQHIVNTIGSVDDLIENYEKQNKIIFNIGIKKINYLNKLKKLFNLTKIAEFEKGHEVGSLKYIYKNSDKLVHYLRVADLKTLSETFIDSQYDEKIANYNDILLALDGAPGRNNIGLYGAYSSGIYKLNCSDKNKGLVYFEINSNVNKNIIKQHSHGTTILHASKSIEHLLCANINVNDKNEFNLYFNFIIQNKKKINLLKSIRSSFLKKFF